MRKIGILAIQGAFKEHAQIMRSLGCETIEVRTKEQLELVDGLVLPGGESTAMLRQLHDGPLFEALQSRIREGLPVMGTCAGMVLLSRGVEGESLKPLDVMDITVKRNAYGRQLDSFVHEGVIPGISDNPIQQVFIRAPYITRTGPDVEVFHEVDGHIVAAREKNMLALSFHPELADQKEIHDYFLEMCYTIR